MNSENIFKLGIHLKFVIVLEGDFRILGIIKTHKLTGKIEFKGLSYGLFVHFSKINFIQKK